MARQRPTFLRFPATHALLAVLIFTAFTASPHAFATTKAEVESAKNALDLKLYQATTDALIAQREAEIRKATAEAERAELLAKLPPTDAKALQGTIDTEAFGAAGLVRAFDLAQQLAVDVCAALPNDKKTTIYEPTTTQGVAGARMVSDAVVHLSTDLARQNDELQKFIDRHAPPASPVVTAFSVVTLAAVPATIKAVADITSLAKSNITVASIGYGEGARALFVTALGKACPGRIVGLGSGYLGELDTAQYDKLIARVRALVMQRAQYASRIAQVQAMAEGAKGEPKKELAAVASAAAVVLKTVDGFIDSLKVGEASDKSPLFNAARYLGYGERAAGAFVLDVDLRLEGMTVIKQNLFSGQHLRLSGVAFLWYRLYEPNGSLRSADAMRRMTSPVEVDLRGEDVEGDFWDRQPSRGAEQR